MANVNNMLMRYPDVEALLGVPRATVRFWVAEGRIPYIRLSPRCVRFRREDIEVWLAANRVLVTNDNGAAREEVG